MALTFNDIKEAYSLRKNLRTIFIRDSDRWAFMDGYRFLGILLVIVGHSIAILQSAYGMSWWRETVENIPVYLQVAVNGDIMIDAFFVISSFLMTNILLKQYQESQRIRAGIFLLSRYMRLTPAYLLAIGVFLLISPDAWDKKTVWPNFLYVQNFIGDYDQIFMHFTWSLAVEEQFYVLLPPFLLFIFLRSNHKFAWLIGLFILSFFVRAYVVLNDEIIRTTPHKEIIFDRHLFGHTFITLYDNLYTRFGAFVCGIFVAYVYRYHPEKMREFLKTPKAKWLAHISLFGGWILLLFPVLYKDVLFTYEFNLAWQIGRRNLFCLALAWLMFCALFETNLAGRFHGILSSKFFYPFGHLLYSMYLFHYLAVGLVMANLMANLKYFEIDIQEYFIGWILLASFFSFILTMMIALVSFLIVELPVMNLRPK